MARRARSTCTEPCRSMCTSEKQKQPRICTDHTDKNSGHQEIGKCTWRNSMWSSAMRRLLKNYCKPTLGGGCDRALLLPSLITGDCWVVETVLQLSHLIRYRN